MQWVHYNPYLLPYPLLHPRKFGGKQGTPPAQATQTILDDVDRIEDVKAIMSFDIYHAFDGPPKCLIFAVLDRMGTPL